MEFKQLNNIKVMYFLPQFINQNVVKLIKFFFYPVNDKVLQCCNICNAGEGAYSSIREDMYYYSVLLQQINSSVK
jgi:hypothetical protein